MTALHVGDRALEVRVVGPLAAVTVLVPDVDLLVQAVQQRLLRLGGQPFPRGVGPEPDGLRQRLDEAVEVVAHVPAGPRGDRALVQGLGRVGDDELRVDLHPGAEAGAVRAGAPRRVEAERPRLELVEGQVVVQAGQVLGVHPLAVRVVLRQVDEVEDDDAARQAERGLDRVGEPPPRGVLDGEPVDDDLDVVLLVLLQRGQDGRVVRHLVQPDDRAVDAGPGVALGLQFLEQLGELALAAAHDRGEDLEPGAVLELEDPVHDLLRGLPRDRAAADRAVRLADAGEQQPQVVVHLGDRADGGPRVAARGLLVDGDRRRQAVDEVHVRLVHLAEELPGVRRQRLDVPPLPLGEDRVERQAGLAGPGQAGEHDHGVAREVERDILEVVLACAANDKPVSHCALFSSSSSYGHAASRQTRCLAMLARGSDILPGHEPQGVSTTYQRFRHRGYARGRASPATASPVLADQRCLKPTAPPCRALRRRESIFEPPVARRSGGRDGGTGGSRCGR